MGLAKAMTTGNERNRLLVIHRHAGEGLPNISRRSDWIRLAVRPLRIHVNQSHLNRPERMLELAISAVPLVREPLAFGAPVDVLIGLPDVLAASAKTEGLEAHGLKGDV